MLQYELQQRKNVCLRHSAVSSLAYQAGLRNGGKVKYRTPIPTFPKFPIPSP